MIKVYTIDESMFDSGFNNLRMKLANYFKDKYEISNVTKTTLGKEDMFIAKSKINPAVSFRFINTGNGVKCPGFLNNASLAYAFDKIITFMK